MISLTIKERETILLLFKDLNTFYNSNSISKVLNISHVGSQKIFKRLLKENIVVNKKIGKSIIYKLNLNNDYAKNLLTFLLSDEANNYKMWKEEFRELFYKENIVMLFGSILKNFEKANDIDLMIITDNKNINEINKVIKEKENLLPKKLNTIRLTQKDLLENIKSKDKVIIEIVKNAVILYGQEKYVEVIKNVTSI